MKKRSHKNDLRRVTARERVHLYPVLVRDCEQVILGPGQNRIVHSIACNVATKAMGEHARATLARARRKVIHVAPFPGGAR